VEITAERSLSTVGVGVPDSLLRLVLTFLVFVARLGPDLFRPGLSFGLGDEPGVEQVFPALLVPLGQLRGPIGDDNPAAALKHGFARAERADRDVADAECVIAIGGNGHPTPPPTP